MHFKILCFCAKPLNINVSIFPGNQITISIVQLACKYKSNRLLMKWTEIWGIFECRIVTLSLYLWLTLRKISQIICKSSALGKSALLCKGRLTIKAWFWNVSYISSRTLHLVFVCTLMYLWSACRTFKICSLLNHQHIITLHCKNIYDCHKGNVFTLWCPQGRWLV